MGKVFRFLFEGFLNVSVSGLERLKVSEYCLTFIPTIKDYFPLNRSEQNDVGVLNMLGIVKRHDLTTVIDSAQLVPHP